MTFCPIEQFSPIPGTREYMAKMPDLGAAADRRAIVDVARSHELGRRENRESSRISLIVASLFGQKRGRRCS